MKNDVGNDLYRGDCLDMLRGMEDSSADAVVCDPPYGLGTPPDAAYVLRQWLAGEEVHVKGGGFMGREWDAFVPSPEVWRECFRVLKPGGHLIAFAGTRTVDWMGLALRLGGMQPRDVLHWAYWSGFPKSMDLSKAIDRAAGAEREVTRTLPRNAPGASIGGAGALNGQERWYPTDANEVEFRDNPATPEAARWEGWGTAVKPAIEPAWLCRKPFRGTVADNVQRYGTGALNIDACRFGEGDPMWPGPQTSAEDIAKKHAGMDCGAYEAPSGVALWLSGNRMPQVAASLHASGRYPANLLYCPKPSTAERERGCDGLPVVSAGAMTDREEGSAGLTPRAGAGRSSSGRRNSHPTVKPVSLLRHMVRLVTPPGGLVVDPFAGSGSCGVAAALEGMRYLGAELTEDYWPIAEARIAHALAHPEAWGDTVFGGKASSEIEEARREGQIGLF